MGLSQEQLEFRKSGWGASEIASLAGLNPWCSRSEAILRKQGKMDPIPTTPAMERGNYIEPVIGRWFADKTGYKVVSLGHKTMRHPEHEWMLATPDFGFHKNGSGIIDGIMEAKTAAFSQAAQWGKTSIESPTDSIPPRYNVQVHVQAAVCSANMDMEPITDVPVVSLVDGEFRMYKVKIDPEVNGILVDIGKKAWDEVVSGEDPTPDGSKGFSDFLTQKWPETREDILEADADGIELCERLNLLTDKIKGLTEDKTLLQQNIKNLLGDAPGIQGTFGKIWWKYAKSTKPVAWKAMAEDLLKDLPEEKQAAVLDQFTGYKPGIRSFRCYFK